MRPPHKHTRLVILLIISDVLLLAPPANAQVGCPPDFWVDGLEAGQEFGHKVAYAGDQNDDGYGDFLVGTWYPDPGTFGKVYCFSGLDGALMFADADIIQEGNDPDIYGSYVIGGKDLNGFGGIDYVVSSVRGGSCCSAFGGGGDAGMVHMKSFTRGSLGSLGKCISGFFSGQQMGSSVAFMGDVSGDLLDELAIGANLAVGGGTARGKVFVWSFELQVCCLISCTPHNGVMREYSGLKDRGMLGWEVDGMGDINGDAVPDIVASAPTQWWMVNDTGYVYALSGAASEAILWVAKAPGPGTLFGYDVNNAGDIDGDGKNDVIVGEQASPAGGGGSGRIWVLSGADGSVIWDRAGAAPGIALGLSVIGLGDVNSDGTPDVAAAAPWFLGRGRVYIYSGVDGSILSFYDPPGASEAFGYNLGSGDLNADGVQDLIVGAKDYDSQRGRVYVYYLGDSDGDGTANGCDNCPAIPNPGNETILTGDLNDDGSLTAADIISTVNYVFKSAAVPEPCEAVADVNCTELVNSSDIIYLVNHVFKSGPEPCNICDGLLPPSNCDI